jgi:hypothetical protein
MRPSRSPSPNLVRMLSVAHKVAQRRLRQRGQMHRTTPPFATPLAYRNASDAPNSEMKGPVSGTFE